MTYTIPPSVASVTTLPLTRVLVQAMEIPSALGAKRGVSAAARSLYVRRDLNSPLTCWVRSRVVTTHALLLRATGTMSGGTWRHETKEAALDWFIDGRGKQERTECVVCDCHRRAVQVAALDRVDDGPGAGF